MAVTNPAKVPEKRITSTDIISFNGGLDERAGFKADKATFGVGRNAMVTSVGLVTPRFAAKRWLPDTLGTVHDVSPVLIDEDLYYFTADDQRIKYIQAGDTDWTPAGTAEVSATKTTALTGSNNDLVFTAVQSGYLDNRARGALGNGVTVAYVNAGASKPLVVTVTTLAISVQLATNGSSVITSTANDVMAAVNAHLVAKTLVVATLAPGNTGAGLVTAMTAGNLSGGVDSSNEVSTGAGLINTLIRSDNKLYNLNGADTLRYVDLDTLNMVQYLPVSNPSNAPTASVSGSGVANSGNSRVYYAISFNGAIGQTAVSTPIILTYTVNKSRIAWKTDGTDFVDVTRNNTAPTNAVSWNLYVATDASGGTIAPTDLMPLMKNIDLATTVIRDTGGNDIDLSIGTAPEDNTTNGPKAQYAELTNDQLILYGDPDNPYTLYIKNQFDSGFYEHTLNVGTNYFPKSVVGFRNGQGIPSLTVLSSNTKGLSKQTIIEQKTITYGDSSFVVWTNTEQNYGAAGVSSPYAVINYNGALMFPTTDGFVTMDTEASLQNVLATKRISDPLEATVGSIRNANLELIVGTAWSNRVYWLVPSRGYSYNNEIIVRDVTNPEGPIWYKFDIAAQWIGTISPSDSSAFVYFCQDNHIFRLEKAYVAVDETADGLLEEFPVEARGSLIGTTEAHNAFVSIVQVVFYLVGFIGAIEIGVTYRNENGKMKTKSKTIQGGAYASSNAGGWDDPGYLYSGTGETLYKAWDDFPYIYDTDTATKKDIRIRLPLNVLTNEMQWFVNTDINQPSSFLLRSVSYEGVAVGVKGDLRLNRR